MRWIPLTLLALACSADKDVAPLDSDVPDVIEEDLDGDGVSAEEGDCDDDNAGVYPGAEELCDGADGDCDGAVDESPVDGQTYYVDADGDGYGDEAAAVVACEPPEGAAVQAGDCDDGDAAYNPAAPEDDCTDPNDYNCDGSVGYADADGDGFAACEECDDGDAAVNPSAVEVCDGLDNDCDGEADAGALDAQTYWQDVDADGYGDVDFPTQACEALEGYADNAEDCVDTDPAIHPGEDERCDEVDQDCDGAVDEGAVDAATWYIDYDGDGYGATAYTLQACAQPTGYVADASDCDDTESSAYPGAAEVCDGQDNDCDGDSDEADAADASTWYADSDGDGYGDAATSSVACEAPSGHVSDASDCDDGDGAVNPSATEVCDGQDNDCDGDSDEADATDASTWYADDDGDSYGDAAAPADACDQPSGYVADDSDCDDAEASVFPGNAEVCDGLDNDCDGSADDGQLGLSALCAAESCAEVLADDSAAADGDYYLDPEGDGGAALYTCDMSTDGGGWTLVLDWDRQNDGDTQADFEATLTEVTNNMSDWSQHSGYIRWSDYNSTADVMRFDHAVEVPNGGEALLDAYVYAYSHEDSAVFFSGETSSGLEEIWCSAWWGWNTTFLNAWSSAEQAYHPYQPNDTCSDYHNGSTTTYTFNTPTQAALSGEITNFNLTSFHYDGGYGDYTRLYYLALWVR